MAMTIQAAARWLTGRNGFLILTHKRPDGDTLGCAAGLCLALKALGKTAWILPNADTTSLFLPYLEGLLAPAEFVPAAVITVDIASEGLFPQNALPYAGKVDLAIDHHPSNEGFAQNNCVEPARAACGEIIYDIVSQWFPIPRAVALPLYVAVATDTGCFQYSNTTPDTHRVAASLMETGINAAAVNKRHFRTKSYTRLRLEARIMETLELWDEGQIALAAISLSDLSELKAREEDVEDIAAFVGQLEGVHTAVTIREIQPGECKLSVRTGPALNASLVCSLLGGGGHAAASGCTVKGSVDDAKQAILNAIRQVQRES